MKDFLSQSDTLLIQSSSVFPNNFFPDKIAVHLGEVEIVSHKQGRKSVQKLLIEHISEVSVEESGFSADILLTDSSNERNPITLQVNNIGKKVAYQIESVIEGVIKAKNRNIQLLQLDEIHLKSALHDLGLIIDTFEFEKLGEKNVSHYHGDVVRILFLINGALMLIFLPFFLDRLIIHYSVAILGVLAIALFAGLTNPKSLFVILLDLLISVIGFFVFEFTVLEYFDIDLGYAVTNQLYALIFFISIYFSTKTLRGFYVQ